jgi:hypothetical protein
LSGATNAAVSVAALLALAASRSAAIELNEKTLISKVIPLNKCVFLAQAERTDNVAIAFPLLFADSGDNPDPQYKPHLPAHLTGMAN